MKVKKERARTDTNSEQGGREINREAKEWTRENREKAAPDKSARRWRASISTFFHERFSAPVPAAFLFFALFLFALELVLSLNSSRSTTAGLFGFFFVISSVAWSLVSDFWDRTQLQCLCKKKQKRVFPIKSAQFLKSVVQPLDPFSNFLFLSLSFFFFVIRRPYEHGLLRNWWYIGWRWGSTFLFSEHPFVWLQTQHTHTRKFLQFSMSTP